MLAFALHMFALNCRDDNVTAYKKIVANTGIIAFTSMHIFFLTNMVVNVVYIGLLFNNCKLLNDGIEHFPGAGNDSSIYGTHFIRKGVASYVLVLLDLILLLLNTNSTVCSTQNVSTCSSP